MYVVKKKKYKNVSEFGVYSGGIYMVYVQYTLFEKLEDALEHRAQISMNLSLASFC